MIKQLSKVGNSAALILDKPLLELIGLEEGGKVQITVTDGSLVISPVNPRPIPEELFRATLDRVVEDWGDVLRKLA